jgi:hypothetical protein
VVRRGATGTSRPRRRVQGPLPFAQAPAVYHWINQLKGVPVGGAPGLEATGGLAVGAQQQP